MAGPRDAASWLGPPESMLPQWRARPGAASPGLLRLWRAFMAVRILTGAVLLLLQCVVWVFGQAVPIWLLMLSTAYLLGAVLVRVKDRPRLPMRALDLRWLLTVGFDVAFFAVLEWLQTGVLNYAPLFALPVLLAAILGTLQLALGTAALVTMIQLVQAWDSALSQPGDTTARFLQAGLTGLGLFLVAMLAQQLAERLAREEQRSLESQRAERMQSLVNALVIDNITDGVLVVDAHAVVRAANPAAYRMLGMRTQMLAPPFSLRRETAWQNLADLVLITHEQHQPQDVDVAVSPADEPPLRLHVRTRLTAGLGEDDTLCVFFMQDLREREAQARTEKLAAMGRMSAAVAHEIRNPLAAIAQANALLEEDLDDPALRRLTRMVGQNAQRLSRIVEDVLDVARVQQPSNAGAGAAFPLDAVVHTLTVEWATQSGEGARLSMQLAAGHAGVRFEPDHLRRILVNLLDNAARYAGEQADSIQLSTEGPPGRPALLRVWSDGPPLEQAVERHLFEPFFSSEARSSGLGLHICRELCERHGARIGYARTTRMREGREVHGNEFYVSFRTGGSTATIGA